MTVPFDQYQRYKNASDLINAVRENNQTYSILEVGANEHKNLEKFLLEDQITYLDIVVPKELKKDPSYIEGDATNMPIENDKFDFVIALDVFEHISGSLRKDFISELMRVSKYGFILAAPFNTPGVEDSEIRANLYFETMYGFKYQWLEEHRQNGLPETEELIQHLNEKKWPFNHFSHGNLDIWEKMIKIHFLATGRESLYEYRATIDDYYNDYIYSMDYKGPCYRNFFFVSEDQTKVNKIQDLIHSRHKQDLDKAILEKLDYLERDLINLSSYDLGFKELSSKNNQIDLNNQEIKQKNSQIELNNEEIKQKNSQIESINQEITKKDSQILLNVQEIKQRNSVIERIEKELIDHEQKNKTLTDNIEALTIQFNEQKSLETEKEVAIAHSINHIATLQNEIDVLKQTITGKDNYIEQLELISQQLRLKNRVKSMIPKKIRSRVKFSLSLIKKLKNNPELAKKGFNEIRHNGINSLNNKIHSVITVSELTSDYTITDINIDDLKHMAVQIEHFTYKPLISVVIPVYNVEPKWLELAINSVKEQVYQLWEICIVDDCSTNMDTIQYLDSINDPRITIHKFKENSGISSASNMAVSLASGDYIALLDNDDEVTKDALFEVVKAINMNKADILYSDEDKVDVNGVKKNPFHKPDWSPDLLRSQMYIGHFLVFKKILFEQVGGFRAEFNGSQDYDLVLRMSEVAQVIHHIPKVLYSWRELETSTALNPYAKPYAHTAGLAAVNEHLIRVFGEGNAYAIEDENLFVYDSRYKIGSIKVSIIIPTKDKIELLDPCVLSILEKTNYPDYEIIIINNNSVEQETFDWFAKQKDNNLVRVIDADYEFNWSKLNNHGIRESNGEVYVFLNNDTIVISEDWLQRLVEKSQRDDVGTVGGLLLYEDNTIQHAGVVVGLGGWADHIFKGMKPNHFGSPYVSPMVTRNVLASTGACLAISKKTLGKIGLFNEEFIICGSDVEISLRAIQHDLVNIYDPHIKLFHLESKSRSSYIPPIDFELSALHYGPYLKSGDPYFNRNLSLKSLVPKLSQGELTNV